MLVAILEPPGGGELAVSTLETEFISPTRMMHPCPAPAHRVRAGDGVRLPRAGVGPVPPAVVLRRRRRRLPMPAGKRLLARSPINCIHSSTLPPSLWWYVAAAAGFITPAAALQDGQMS
jgi:hypothetical protein